MMASPYFCYANFLHGALGLVLVDLQTVSPVEVDKTAYLHT